jgi:hypothetical protein
MKGGQKMTASAQERIQRYRDFLTSEGYQPEVDTDGDLHFKHEGGNYWITVEEDDPYFVRVLFPNFWSIDSDEERTRALMAADHANHQCKVAKVSSTSAHDNMMASFEAFFDKDHPEDFRPVFRRALSSLQYAVNTFREHM